jgi:hypothetical protein
MIVAPKAFESYSQYDFVLTSEVIFPRRRSPAAACVLDRRDGDEVDILDRGGNVPRGPVIGSRKDTADSPINA